MLHSLPSNDPVDRVWQKNNPGAWLASGSRTIWPGLLFIVVATLLAYAPIYSAGFIWDDDDYIFNNQYLADWPGLKTMWLHPGATVQYYPLVFTTFWLEFHLWGLHPFGFHVVNVLLHLADALLLWRVLSRLQVPGAWLAAAIFALHPVEVESVAWITERKNVLSTGFYLLAALAWLRYSGLEIPNTTGRWRWFYYLAALLLFLAALFSKTVTSSLPAAMLLVLWWKRGRLGMREILPALPFFLAGLASGFITAWLEKTRVGAQGADWAFTGWDRCLIAGRALWFYAGKLVFPCPLTFIYPRWKIDPALWWQWLFPVAALGVVMGLWRVRRRIGRGPLVAVLFFAGTLFPALGFVNVYPMRFSFVADHFQYLAGVGLIVLGAAGLERFPRVIQIALLAVCGLLTCFRCHAYQNLETLWADTLAKNPACWMAHTNLGRLLVAQGKLADAETHYRAALDVTTNVPDIHYNYANLLARTGRLDESVIQYQQALQLDPGHSDAHNNLGVVLLKQHLTDDAIRQYQAALALKPDAMNYHYNLGSALAAEHRVDEALVEFRRALQLAPDSALIKRRLRELGEKVN